jgi:NADP-dependent 3-hydroxy acid dehydrogenase YdfG
MIGAIMSIALTYPQIPRKPELLGETVIVIGGSSGIGLETARLGAAKGAKLILTGRCPDPLQRVVSEVDALSATAFDATDPVLLEQFRNLPSPVDHIMVTAGQTYYGRLIDLDFAQACRALDEHLLLFMQVSRNAANEVNPEGLWCSWSSQSSGQ